MYSQNLRKKRQNGFTLLEVVIALLIFTLGILGVAAMQLRSIQGNASGQRLTEATTQAQEVLERILIEPYVNFSPTKISSYPKTFPTIDVPPFKIIPLVEEMPGGTMAKTEAVRVTATVTWREANGLDRSVAVSFIKSAKMETSYEVFK